MLLLLLLFLFFFVDASSPLDPLESLLEELELEERLETAC
jgi:hypothetical protein